MYTAPLESEVTYRLPSGPVTILVRRVFPKLPPSYPAMSPGFFTRGFFQRPAGVFADLLMNHVHGSVGKRGHIQVAVGTGYDFGAEGVPKATPKLPRNVPWFFHTRVFSEARGCFRRPIDESCTRLRWKARTHTA